MGRLIAVRVASSAGILLLVSFVVFAMIDLIPGDPAVILAGENASADRIESLRASLNLDAPLHERYATWLAHAIQGDLGNSLQSGQPVTRALGSPVGVTVSLVFVTLVFSSLLGLTLGILAAARRGSLLDKTVGLVSAVSIAVPAFWAGLVLVSIFALGAGWLPAVGYVPLTEDPVGWLRHLLLPAIALGTLPVAEMALQIRDSMTAELKKAYVQVAWAKGVGRTTIILRHALKNAAIPVVTVFGYRAGQLLGGAVTVEVVFALPGLGQLAVTSVLARDVNVLLGMVVVTTVAVVVINLLVDISYGYLNPKVRT